jgi:hypothetical protein
MLAGALRAYKRSLELHREAVRAERDQRLRTLRRVQAVRARNMQLHGMDNGDASAAPQVGLQHCFTPPELLCLGCMPLPAPHFWDSVAGGQSQGGGGQ